MNPNSSPHARNERGVYKPACKPLLNLCTLNLSYMRLEALLELQNPRIDKESLMFGFAGSFMIILSFMRILSYLPPCIFPLASPPMHLSSLLPFPNNKTKKTAGTSHKKVF